MPFPKTTRRQALSATALGLITPAAHLFTAHLFTSHLAASESDPPHEFRFLLASSLYGYAPVADVLQQV
ncbi:MAG: hypothetical protein KDA91_24475, partial [Planctomycetaceae bacterium]|nr:hypothetical protein [Planctomycetaceae bacterium]